MPAVLIMIIEKWILWCGAAMAYITLGVSVYGIWRGARRPAGMTSGQATHWLRSATFYLPTVALFLAFSIMSWNPLPLTLSPGIRALALAAGSLVYFPGLGFTLWGRRALGSMYFVSTSLGVQLFTDHQLVTHGPFAIVRHPMYLGLITAAIGSLLLYQTWTIVIYGFVSPFLLLRARREERALAAEFGEAWNAYSARVPMILPRRIRSEKTEKES